MGIFFNASEVCQFAIRIEENGEMFYRKIAEKFDDEKIKKLFIYLADEEVNHKQIFQEMTSQIEDFQPPESYPGEYYEYLKVYVDRIIFDEESIKREFDNIQTPLDAVEFGSRRELDSILYYQEIKHLVNEPNLFIIDKIINEERKHFLKLSELHNIFRSAVKK